MKFLTVLTMSLALAACGKTSSDEEQVREVFAAVEKAAEARDASDVLEHVAASYSDSRGTDRAQLQTFLRGYFLGNPKVDVSVDIEQLELPVPGLAQVRADVLVLPAGDQVTLDVELRREDGQWKVVRAGRARED